MEKPISLYAHPMHWEAVKTGKAIISQALDKVIRKMKDQKITFQEANEIMEKIYRISKEIEDLSEQEEEKTSLSSVH